LTKLGYSIAAAVENAADIDVDADAAALLPRGSSIVTAATRRPPAALLVVIMAVSGEGGRYLSASLGGERSISNPRE